MPIDLEAYLDAIRNESCALAGVSECSHSDLRDIHHLIRKRNRGKMGDLSVVPLCRKHHNYIHNAGEKRCMDATGINLWFDAIRYQNRLLPQCLAVSGDKEDFYDDLLKLINKYCDHGLKKIDLVANMKYATESCELS